MKIYLPYFSFFYKAKNLLPKAHAGEKTFRHPFLFLEKALKLCACLSGFVHILPEG